MSVRQVRRTVLAVVLAAAASFPALRPVAAADYAFNARFDWRSEGDIYQVWLHRRFNGILVQTQPIQIDAGPEITALLSGLTVQCDAITDIGLPNWSVTHGTCTLSRADGQVTMAVEECSGTQKLCQGHWRITDGTGAYARMTGEGTVTGHLIYPDPLPWLWNDETRGYNELVGTITIP